MEPARCDRRGDDGLDEQLGHITRPATEDLKLGEFDHADAGQMHLYLNFAKQHWMVPGENPPVGLILCSATDEAIVRYSLDGHDSKVLATEYRMALPDEKLIADHVEQTRLALTRRAPKGSRPANATRARRH
jgi:hypothetical protein